MRAAVFLALASLGISSPAATAPQGESDGGVTYHTVKVEGLDIFYREAGGPRNPTIVLLHGRQTSSHMFRDVIPRLATRYHVIAPDLPGFGQSDTPVLEQFPYTFDHLATVSSEFIAALGVKRYALLMHDFGVPIGMRVATRDPAAITFLVVQNGIICDPAEPHPLWLQPFWDSRDPAAEKRLRASYQLKTTRKYYLMGAQNPARVSPDAWMLAQAYLDSQTRQDLQVELMHDDPANARLFPTWRAYLRRYRPPILVQWGKDSPISDPDQAECYGRDDPNTRLTFYVGGQFLLEEHAAAAAAEILAFRPKVAR